MSDEQKEPQGMIPLVEPGILFCDLVSINITPDGEVFDLAFGSGGAIVKRFAFTRSHLQRLSDLLQKKIVEFDGQKSN